MEEGYTRCLLNELQFQREKLDGAGQDKYQRAGSNNKSLGFEWDLFQVWFWLELLNFLCILNTQALHQHLP